MGVNKSKSIIQDEMACYVTGRTDNLDPMHHVFFGIRRPASEKFGVKIWLTREVHDEWHCARPNAKYITQEKKEEYEKEIQLLTMEYYNWTVDEWIKKFGKNYI